MQVNREEVSLRQVEYLLKRQPGLPADQAPRLVLASLVEQEIAAQAAREDGIDKDPEFVQGIEAARRELLAKLYQERIAAKAARASSDEVDRYYDEHPALFSARRLYTVQEVAVDAGPGTEDKLRALVAAAAAPAGLDEALDRAGWPHRGGLTVLAPERVPLALLQPLAALEEGHSMVAGGAPSLRVWTLLKTQAAPVAREAAKPAIESYLVGERRRQLVTQRMAELRQSAKVVVAEAFASSASAPTTH